MPSIFTRIIAGEIPSYKVYEDEYLYAFLDIRPLHLGHTLVVPKVETGSILDMDDALYTHLMLTAKNIIGPAIQKSTNCVRIGYSVEGFGVPDHIHLHLIPLNQAGDLDPAKGHIEEPEKMIKIAENIKMNIQ
ncbi:HIT family protein [Candidatus Gracilibacteria bacterium]|nr:HIT family protein [Candidatus Gracilibacteria bacterium]